ncbi:MAG TPA: CsiV family protein [Steroidobacteraceae bacterium]|nr:CsiV family protein [Steroidobacteraceae bacterium]
MPHSHRLGRTAGVSLALIAALLSSSLPAQDSTLQQFDVEMVIFRVNNPSFTQEDWALEEARAKAKVPTAVAVADGEEVPPPLDTGAAVTVTQANESSIQPTSVAQFRLNSVENSLRRSRAYMPLAHVGWSQPGFAMNNPRPLAIESLLPPNAGVTGTVSMVRGRYLHMTVELSFVSPIDGKRYVLREQRRMRSGEKHYFDHPVFGVVVLVTPKS